MNTRSLGLSVSRPRIFEQLSDRETEQPNMMELVVEREAGLDRQIDLSTTEALGRLYDEYAPRLWHYLLHLLRKQEDAEDAMQNLFVKLARMRYVTLRTGTLAGYLFGAARNEAMNVRDIRRPNPRQLDVTIFAAEGTLREEREQLESALAQLPAEQQEVVVLKSFEGLTFKEIAHALSISLDTAASRYRYGMKKLRSMLGQEDWS